MIRILLTVSLLSLYCILPSGYCADKMTKASKNFNQDCACMEKVLIKNCIAKVEEACKKKGACTTAEKEAQLKACQGKKISYFDGNISDSDKEKYQKALTMLKSGELKQALEMLDQVKKNENEPANVWFWRAHIFALLDMPKDCTNASEMSFSTQPKLDTEKHASLKNIYCWTQYRENLTLIMGNDFFGLDSDSIDKDLEQVGARRQKLSISRKIISCFEKGRNCTDLTEDNCPCHVDLLYKVKNTMDNEELKEKRYNCTNWIEEQEPILPELDVNPNEKLN